ncbi:DUF6843 domain-containing protein [Paenibacillus sp. Soil787]|uniref:DUF6843 domain-containing protein n=1 Tax=Paenibacillus sp. Soil787 TaxID=1736411 RepID=UPI00070070EE|nr:hypothetical protein [Paenibacillus sp. Soil787]KRF39833.1 hypothetical protein ASG93_23005 [Paenibacillus sp. Soil787]
MKKMLGITFVVAVLVCLVVGALFISNKSDNPTNKFLLPKDYTGWVEVTFAQTDSTALKNEGNNIIFEVPPSGKIKTSSKNVTGPMRFYYVDEKGTQKEIPTNVEMIHGVSTSSATIGKADGKSEDITEKLSFYVGTKEQWDQVRPSKEP